MAESRRVQLIPVACGVPSFADGSASVQESPSGARQGAEPGSDGATRTVRLVLKLFEPDQRSFPEFNYCHLIESKKSDTSFEDLEEKMEKDDLAEIARQLEEKYGGEQKKKDRVQDLIDIGYGYDEDDSFIDNSEAYDEFVPSSITTKFGGFYVNTGLLHFRQTSDTEEGIIKATNNLKLSSEQVKPKKKRPKMSGEIKSNTKSRIWSETDVDKVKIKKKKAPKVLSVTSMLKKFQREKENERLKLEENGTAAMDVSTVQILPADAAGCSGFSLTDPLLSLIGSTNDHALIQAASTVDFDIDLDTFLDAGEDDLPPKCVSHATTEPQITQTQTDAQRQLNDFSDNESIVFNSKDNTPPKPDPELMQLLTDPTVELPSQSSFMPEGLPLRLEESIRNLIDAAKTSKGESKLKFFSAEINSILLNIELQCQEQSGQVRSRVYRHLSSFMPCSKDTLLKRVRKLLLTREEPPSLEDPLQKLKVVIENSMPHQMACFYENCQAYEQTKTSKETEGENMEEKVGRKSGPKKLFKWNQEIRSTVGEVLKERMEKFEKERKDGMEYEEYLKFVLDKEVKPLWPKGWMQSRILLKESRKLLLPPKAKSLKRHSFGGSSKSTDVCKGIQSEHSAAYVNVSSGAHQRETSPTKSEQRAESDAFPFLGREDETPTVVISAPAQSLLEMLVHQTPVQGQPLAFSQEYFAAAFAKRWSYSVDDRSPPLPPPPPQSSPINFHEGHQLVLP